MIYYGKKLEKFEILIGYDPERDCMFAEVEFNNEVVVSLDEAKGIPVTIYPPNPSTPWCFYLTDFLEVLSRAKARLLGEPIHTPHLPNQPSQSAPPGSALQLIVAPNGNALGVQLWWGGMQWANLSKNSIGLLIEIYPCPTGGPWVFKYDEIMQILTEAQRYLI